jgi:hypothetical protein
MVFTKLLASGLLHFLTDQCYMKAFLTAMLSAELSNYVKKIG